MTGMVEMLVTEVQKIFAGDTPLARAVVLGFRIDGHFVVEVVLVAVIVFLLLQKSYQPEKRPLTKQEIDQLCDEWVPEPLHPSITEEMEREIPILESAAGPHTIVNGVEVVNVGSANYLGMVGDKRIMDACDKTVAKYGVGSCGPRGFYGTIDVHLDCEAKIAKFLGTSDSILYAYGMATVSSAIPAFCKRGDLILADEGVNWAIQNGLYLSRSTLKMFKHNNMKDLETHLEKIRKEDQLKKKSLNRRFIVVEAVYQNSGQITPLPDIIRLKEKYNFRVLVDETHSIGVLGKTGRGLTEHFGIPVEKVDMITAGMEHSFASVGGFCTGNLKVVDHQRLSGAGYCFSASLPPFLATAAIKAFEILEENPDLLTQLHKNIEILRKACCQIPGLVVSSHPLSPIIFLQLQSTSGSMNADTKTLQTIADRLLADESVLVTVTKHSPLDKCNFLPALRVTPSAAHTEAEILSVASALKKTAASVLELDCNGHYDFIE